MKPRDTYVPDPAGLRRDDARIVEDGSSRTSAKLSASGSVAAVVAHMIAASREVLARAPTERDYAVAVTNPAGDVLNLTLKQVTSLGYARAVGLIRAELGPSVTATGQQRLWVYEEEDEEEEEEEDDDPGADDEDRPW